MSHLLSFPLNENIQDPQQQEKDNLLMLADPIVHEIDCEDQGDVEVPSTAPFLEMTTATTPFSVPKPKRSLNCYNFFFQHHRQRILQQNHGQTGGFGNLATRIAQQWKQVTPAERAIFERMAAVDKLRHQRELRAWKQQEKEWQRQQLLQQRQGSSNHNSAEAASTRQSHRNANNHEHDEWAHLVNPTELATLASNLGVQGVETLIRLRW